MRRGTPGTGTAGGGAAGGGGAAVAHTDRVIVSWINVTERLGQAGAIGGAQLGRCRSRPRRDADFVALVVDRPHERLVIGRRVGRVLVGSFVLGRHATNIRIDRRSVLRAHTEISRKVVASRRLRLGHKDATITLSIYAHVLDESDADDRARDAIAAVFGDG